MVGRLGVMRLFGGNGSLNLTLVQEFGLESLTGCPQHDSENEKCSDKKQKGCHY
jgi:hypothetical protein